MAAEYEVNISLNTKKINGQLKTLEKRLSNISKAADPLGSGPGGTQRSRNLDRIRATGVIINRLGRELNKLEAQGVKVQNERSRIKRAVAKLDKGLVETARAHVVEIRDFVKEANKGLKAKEKTVKLDSVQNKFSERRLRALARSNERNEKDLRLNQRMTAEARARMRLLSQSGAKGFDAPRPQGRQMAESINALTDVQDKRARLLNKINEMEAKGLNVQKLRKQLGKATTEQAARRFGSAEKEFRILEKTLRLEQSKLRILREQRKGFAASPVRGTPTMMGSPAQIAAAGRQAADPIRGRANLVGSPAYYEAQQKAIDRLARQGGPSDPVKGHANLVGSPAYYEHQRKELEKAARRGGARSPIGGLTTIPGSPAQIAASARAGGPVSPVKGAANLVGSPAYYEAQAKAISKLARQGGPADPIKGHPNLVGSPAYFDAQRKATERLARQGGAASPVRGNKNLVGSPAYFEHLDREISKLARQGGATSPVRGNKDLIGSPAYYEHQRKELEKLARTGGPRSPIRGGANMPGSPLARQARNKRLEQVGLGAGFPLLFGGGAGSIIGGGLGGLTGSFGAQIALSAIGQQIDQFVAGMVDAGKALTSVGGAADFMAEKSLFSSDSMQFRIEKLIEEGQVTEAAALMTKEMAKQVGGTGLKALKDLGDEANKMGKLFNALILQVQAFISRALTPLLAAINKVVGDVVLNNQFNALMSEATGARKKEIEKFLEPYTKKVRKGAAAKDVVTSEGRRLAVEKFGGQVIPEGAAIEPTGLELLRAADSGTDKAAKKAERQQLEAFLALNKQMTAELDRQDEINAMNGKYIAEQLNNADKINDSQEKRAGLLQARINGTEEEFRLDQAIKEIKEKGLLPADEKRLIAAEEQIHAMEKQAKQVERLEQLYQQVGSAIENALVDGIMAAIDGTKSLQSIVSSLLKDVGKMFLQFGIRTALNSVSPSVFPMAQGGFVSSPTRALVGEGGQGEYVIPENKMRESMARYSRGARGSAVIPDSGTSGTSGEGGGTAVAAPIDVRFSVERINNVDYVTAEEFQAGLQQAASQGAQRGQQLALTRLQQSPATRRRLGL